MEPTVPIPRQALAELLQAAGYNLTPEQYLATLQVLQAGGAPGTSDLYRRRARAAVWSRNVLLIVAILSVVFLPFAGLDVEGVIVTVGLCLVTYFEFRVHRYFVEGDPRAPGLGYRNQCCFAAGILLYGIYHAYVPVQVPAEYRDMLDPTTMAMMQNVTRMAYLLIGAVGGISQFALAIYYRRARAAA